MISKFEFRMRKRVFDSLPRASSSNPPLVYLTFAVEIGKNVPSSALKRVSMAINNARVTV